MNTSPDSRYYQHLAELCRAYDRGIAPFTQSPMAINLQNALGIAAWHGDPTFACALGNVLSGSVATITGQTNAQQYAVVQRYGLYFDCTGVHYAFELLRDYRQIASNPDLALHHVGRPPMVTRKPRELDQLETLLKTFIADAIDITDLLKPIEPAA